MRTIALDDVMAALRDALPNKIINVTQIGRMTVLDKANDENNFTVDAVFDWTGALSEFRLRAPYHLHVRQVNIKYDGAALTAKKIATGFAKRVDNAAVRYQFKLKQADHSIAQLRRHAADIANAIKPLQVNTYTYIGAGTIEITVPRFRKVVATYEPNTDMFTLNISSLTPQQVCSVINVIAELPEGTQA